MERYTKGLFVAVVISATIFAAGSVFAAPLTMDQFQQVTNLLTALNVDAQKIKAIEAILLSEQPKEDKETVGWCSIPVRDIGYGVRDTAPNGDVTKLQVLLGVSPTGYFGPMTQEAVKKWQSANGVVSAGTPDTTGYGYVGPRTRTAIGRLCTKPVDPKISFTASPTTAIANTTTVTFSAHPEAGVVASRYYVDFGNGIQADTKETAIFCMATSCPKPIMTASHVYTKSGTYTATLNRRFVCNSAPGQVCPAVYSEQVAKATVVVVTNEMPLSPPPAPTSVINP